MVFQVAGGPIFLIKSDSKNGFDKKDILKAISECLSDELVITSCTNPKDGVHYMKISDSEFEVMSPSVHELSTSDVFYTSERPAQ